MPSDPTPAFLAEREQRWREQPHSYRLQSYHWLRALTWLSYAVVIILLIIVLVPGGWNPNDERWKPTRGLEIFSFELNTTEPASNPSNSQYIPIQQVVVTLSTTCVAPEETTHGGGTCFSNLSPSMWSIHAIPQYNGSQPSTTYFNIPIDAPNIDIRTIFTLLVISLIISFLVLLQLVLTPGCTGRSLNRDGRTKRRGRFRHALGWFGTVWPLVVVGSFGFIFGLAGIALLRVQVSQTVDALMNASVDEVHRPLFYSSVEEDTSVFWTVLGFAVALMGINPILLAIDGWFWPVDIDSR